MTAMGREQSTVGLAANGGNQPVADLGSTQAHSPAPSITPTNARNTTVSR